MQVRDDQGLPRPPAAVVADPAPRSEVEMAMSDHIFQRLLTGWDRTIDTAEHALSAAGHLTAHADTMTASPPALSPQETDVSVPDAVAALKTNIETIQAAAVTITDTINATLSDDVPGLEDIGSQIDNSRIIQSAVAAEGIVPQAVLDDLAGTIDSLTAAFQPAVAPPAPEAPAEPVTEPQPA